jgi:hypothetical protein
MVDTPSYQVMSGSWGYFPCVIIGFPRFEIKKPENGSMGSTHVVQTELTFNARQAVK